MVTAKNNRITNVLIVDDDPNNLQILGNLLRELGYKIDFALDGIEALNWLSKKQFDLILLDVVMPRMNGYEVCERIKSNKKTCNIPIVFITSKTEIEDTVKGLELGAVDYLTKPFNKSELKARISTHIKLKHATDELKLFSEKLEQKNKFIIDSIVYAERIQHAILPKKESLKNIFPESFVFFRPRDIVSGDFYYIKRKLNTVFIAVIDCTGHGVPGAMMSMIGYLGLNQAINEKNLNKSNEILKYLNNFVIKALNKDEYNNSIHDGMNISLLVIDLEDKKLHFSGALQPLYIIRNNKILEYRGVRKSIGEIDALEQEFHEETISIELEDSFYLFSDGFPDQFGGELGKKFGYKRFRDTLLEMQSNSMEKQGRFVEQVFYNWKVSNDQVDDVTLIGFKYNNIKIL